MENLYPPFLGGYDVSMDLTPISKKVLFQKSCTGKRDFENNMTQKSESIEPHQMLTDLLFAILYDWIEKAVNRDSDGVLPSSETWGTKSWLLAFKAKLRKHQNDMGDDFMPEDRSCLSRFLVWTGNYEPDHFTKTYRSAETAFFKQTNSRHQRGPAASRKTVPYVLRPQDRTLTWPPGDIPVEVLQNVAKYSCRRDIKSLISTCKEFNQKLGPLFFRHVVLPFNTDTFVGNHNNSTKSYVVAQQQHPELSMFQNWGAHFTKLGLSLEVNEDDLLGLERAILRTEVRCFWQPYYHWPSDIYKLNRETLSIEAAALKTEAMRRAMSFVTSADELALSMDSGLGFLNGPDNSDRAKLLKDSSAVFGRRFAKSSEELAKDWLEEYHAKLASLSEEDQDTLEAYHYCLRLAFPPSSDILDMLIDLILTFPRHSLAEKTFETDTFVRNLMIRIGFLGPDQHVNIWSKIDDLLVRVARLDYGGQATCIHDSEHALSEYYRNKTRNRECEILPFDRLDLGFERPWLRSLRPQSNFAAENHPVVNCINYRLSAHPDQDFDRTWVRVQRVSGHIAVENYSGTSHAKRRASLAAHHNGRSSLEGPEVLQLVSPFSARIRIRKLDLKLLKPLFLSNETEKFPVIFGGVDYPVFALPADVSDTVHRIESRFESKGLVPRDLSQEQMQWLKEVSWIHQAFLSSFVGSIVANKLNFQTVRKLNLARISTSHLPLLERHEIWMALGSLQELVVMITPEWREIDSQWLGNYESKPVKPSDTVFAFMKLLDVVGCQSNIRTMELGYIGGGEHASGLYARNQNILPAPLNWKGNGHIPGLPFVKKLTLRNCWLAPSKLRDYALSMQKYSLQELTLDSVSLVIAGGKTATILLNQIGLLPPLLEFGIPPFPENTLDLIPLTDRISRDAQWEDQEVYGDTWAGVINVITPGKHLQGLRRNGYKERTSYSQLEPSPRGKLRRLEFKSCGYVRLGFQKLDTLFTPKVWKLSDPLATSQRYKDLEKVMMEAHDPCLGTIVPYIFNYEKVVLTGAWEMSLGWTGIEQWWTKEDGWSTPGGAGRFTGVLERKECDESLMILDD